MHPIRRMFWVPWRRAIADLQQGFEGVLDSGRPFPVSFALVAAAVIVTWVLYVPVHELLHAAGCHLTGCRVEELQIGRWYGGALLARVFPFVVAGGPYAGRLSGFDTGGSDGSYLATVAMPYLLTILGGHLLLRVAARRGSVVPFAVGLVLMTAPVLGLIGDYYEMGSVLVSAALKHSAFLCRLGDPMALRSDDVIALIGRFPVLFPEGRGVWAAAVACAWAVGWLLASLTFEGSSLLAGMALRRKARAER